MTPLLIIGHPSSDYQFVETLLHKQGMALAKASRREQLTPIAISQQLLKTQGIVFDNHRDIDQIEAGEIWNELALDLLLGNIEQP
ncbi:MAG: chromosome partitioning protein ParA, partial [Endozoicomonadaceae bacterium]|nr:chromosome partitioning protein ParA [Endozoicomonadaceae bacterium]